MTHTESTPSECTCCRHKNTPRDPAALRALENRLSRITGQLNGIRGMLDDNRYCADILTQVAAVESALQSFGYAILQEHLESCVVEELERGNSAVLSEAMELIRKLK